MTAFQIEKTTECYRTRAGQFSSKTLFKPSL